MLNQKGFDKWSGDYDESINNSKGYPFEGYYDVLGYVQGQIKAEKTMKILDIGIGTGQLTEELYKKSAEITGVDFSKKMIEEGQKKMPKGLFYQQDLNEGLPAGIQEETFDYIVSSYALHHLNNDAKLKLIEKLVKHLEDDGKIFIADVAFVSEEDLQRCKNSAGTEWDNEEFYMIGGDLIEDLKKRGLSATYRQISSCAGVLQVNNT